MYLNYLCAVAIAILLAGCAMNSNQITASKSPSASLTLAEFQKKAGQFHNVIRIPEFETTPEAVTATVNNAITNANRALDRVGQLGAAKVNFANTLHTLDDIGYEAGLTANRMGLIKETSTNSAVRDAATEAIKTFSEWAVSLDYREDVYSAVKAFADKKPKLAGEEAKLLEETLRDYRRAGLALPKPERDEVERLRKELARLSTDFEANVTKAQKALKFTKAELDGVPDSLLGAPGVKTGGDEYTILVNVTWQYLA